MDNLGRLVPDPRPFHAAPLRRNHRRLVCLWRFERHARLFARPGVRKTGAVVGVVLYEVPFTMMWAVVTPAILRLAATEQWWRPLLVH